MAAVAAAAAAFGAAELVLAIVFGRFFAAGRAEALLFIHWRPWLLLIAILWAHGSAAPRRYSFYGLALLVAAASESLLLIGLGAGHPWPEAVRGFAAAACLALVLDIVLTIGARFGGGWGRLAAAATLLLLLASPQGLAPYHAIARYGAQPEAGPRQDLMVLSALPLRWGEKGPLAPGSRGATAFAALEKEFNIRLLDQVSDPILNTGRLLLAAQPRALTPGEMAALDAWIRRGGRALILTDPQLVWPSDLALGDIRRAPAIGLLDPMLQHWGLAMNAPAQPQWATRHITLSGMKRRLAMFAAGTFAPMASHCELGEIPEIARCRLGAGRAILLSDADMLHDRLWVGPGRGGSSRHGRRSDNPLILADLLDELAEIDRRRIAGSVQWIDDRANPLIAWLLALMPILAAAVPAASPSLFRRA